MGSLHLFVLDREKRKSAECDLSNYYVETMGIHDGWSLQVFITNVTPPTLGFHDGLYNQQHDQIKMCHLFFDFDCYVTNTIMNDTSTLSQSVQQDQP